MSRTLATQNYELRCSNPSCNRHNPILAKSDGIKCRCGHVTTIPAHFYPGHAISGGSIESDWQAHLERARIVGCEICGIEPEWARPLSAEENPSKIHFYPSSALSGGSIENDWARHRQEAKIVGCHICGIKPERPLVGKTTEERYAELQTRLHGAGGAPIYGHGPNSPASITPTPTSNDSVGQPATTSAISSAQAAVSDGGSHSLARRFKRTGFDTRGNDYKLPVFPPAEMSELKGVRVLVISADGPELPEIEVPIEYLKARGAEVVLAGQDWIFQYRNPAGHIVIAEWLSDAISLKMDTRMSDVKLEDFDALFIPGGAWNPDMLRTDEVALRLVREAHRRGLLVASLCHGPQVLINAAFDAPEGQENFPAKDVHITGTGSIRRDLTNAGFVVHNDDPVVYDQTANLLTARDPNDLGPLCLRLGQLLRQALLAKAPHFRG